MGEPGQLQIVFKNEGTIWDQAEVTRPCYNWHFTIPCGRVELHEQLVKDVDAFQFQLVSKCCYVMPLKDEPGASFVPRRNRSILDLIKQHSVRWSIRITRPVTSWFQHLQRQPELLACKVLNCQNSNRLEAGRPQNLVRSSKCSLAAGVTMTRTGPGQRTNQVSQIRNNDDKR